MTRNPNAVGLVSGHGRTLIGCGPSGVADAGRWVHEVPRAGCDV
ncbi:hypothetical protein [uncultured Mobiluncus sp.]|nr:hypothetical protein [uncultured Mobiluncus sp.]